MPDLETTAVVEEAVLAETPEPVEAASDETASLKGALQKERDARKAAEKERKELLKRLSDLEQAGKPEADRIAAERDALKAELDEARSRERLTRGKAAVLQAASEANAVTPGVIYRAIVGDLEFDDSGEPTNVGALVASLRKEAPMLFRPVTGKADAATTATAPAPNNDWIKRGLTARRG